MTRPTTCGSRDVLAASTRYVSSKGRPLAAELVSDNYFEALGTVPRCLPFACGWPQETLNGQRVGMPACSRTYCAMSAAVANHTPGFDFMYATNRSRCCIGARCPLRYGCSVSTNIVRSS